MCLNGIGIEAADPDLRQDMIYLLQFACMAVYSLNPMWPAGRNQSNVATREYSIFATFECSSRPLIRVRASNIFMMHFQLETIGDAFMVAANLTAKDPRHAAITVRFALRSGGNPKDDLGI